MQHISMSIILQFLCLSMLAIPFHLPAPAHRLHARGYTGNRSYQWRGHRSAGYTGRWAGGSGYPFGWPSYYSYYRYPIAGSVYYYSYPTNSNFFYSYPSYSADWTYPSYPFVGKYYVNQTPFYPSRVPPSRYDHRQPPSTSKQKHPQTTSRTSVFISE